jgi:hypothetical protein
MKIFLTLTLLLFGLLIFAQTENNMLNKIRKAVEHINNDSGYAIKKLDNEEFLEHTTDNGGQLTGYFKNGQLVKIIEWIGLSSCVDITEYYLQNNKLIFAYTKGSESPYIDSLQTFDHGTINETMECRFYFSNNKIVKTILKGSTRCSGQPTAGRAKNYLDECSRYTRLLKKRNKLI